MRAIVGTWGIAKIWGDKIEPMSISAEDSASMTKQLCDVKAIRSGGSCDASSCTKRLLHVLTL